MTQTTTKTNSLTTERKAELFDYIASRLSEGKFELSFGGNSWEYHDQGSPEELAETLERLMTYEKQTNEWSPDCSGCTDARFGGSQCKQCSRNYEHPNPQLVDLHH